MKNFTTWLKEKTGIYSKATEKWFEDLINLSELHFEKGESQPELKRALEIAKKYKPYASEGSTTKQYEGFKKEIMKLKDKKFKSLQSFLKNLKAGDYDPQTILDNYGFENRYDLDMYMDGLGDDEQDEYDSISDELQQKQFGLWSNDTEGNSSVVNDVMDSYSQGITYFGDLDDLKKANI